MAKIYKPNKINIGFQERQDTYTGQLAYIIYFDEKNKLRKETSWNSWRDEKIDNVIYDNVPTSGFVLNKKIGGYSSGWNHRATYVRVFDPRGFEFEIGVDNLMYILESNNCIKGKGLEGEFVYGWVGTELVLIPCASTDYDEIVSFSNILNNPTKFKDKDLIIGATYKTNKDTEVVYMGRYYYRKSKYYWFDSKEEIKPYNWSNIKQYNFSQYKTISKSIIACVDEIVDVLYADRYVRMEHEQTFSPHDVSKDEYIPIEFNDFKEMIESLEPRKSKNFYSGMKKYNLRCKWNDETKITICESIGLQSTEYVLLKTNIKEIFDKYKPTILNKYQMNGNLIKE